MDCPIEPKTLTREEILALVPRIKAGDRQAENDACAAMALWVWGASGRLARGPRAYFREDLFFEGLFAVVAAFQRFDPIHKSLPTTYAISRAWPIMLNALRREIKQTQGMSPLGDAPRASSSRWEEELDAAIDVGERMDAAKLTTTELAVIRYRFGLNGHSQLSCRSINKFVRLSPWGVVLSERKAITKLRAAAACA